MFLESLVNRGMLPVLQQVMSFTEARNKVLVNNISNFDTVGYKMKDLPVSEFNASLRKAVARRAEGGAGAPLQMQDTRHLKWDSEGHLQAQAEYVKGNILFHDKNNRFVEKQMAELSENGLLHNVAAELLRQQYGLLQMAIRGRP